jgi:hypothetical protein
MKLFKRNLTSRFAHSARLHKERPSKLKGITTSVGDVLATCAAGLVINRDFHPGARAMLAYNQLSGFRKS